MKIISRENWLEADPVSFLISNQLDSSGFHQMEGEDWVSIIYESELSANVPPETKRLFEVARGAMAYGYFFYPLFTLGCEQVYRVAESAASEKCKQLGASKKKVGVFKDKIEFLGSKGVLSTSSLQTWNAVRNLRNESSHPKQQTILTVGMAIPMMKLIVEEINSLFSGNSTSP